jgi:hypothetical protein
LDAATNYLAHADVINVLAEVYVAASPSGGGSGMGQRHGAAQRAKEICSTPLPGILSQLDNALEKEIHAVGLED